MLLSLDKFVLASESWLGKLEDGSVLSGHAGTRSHTDSHGGL